ncbi:hypothetical protein [Legionella oakridgensis]|uniref:Uncharacterized protein n=2 Tax=Legionella oakridgensis TaxID=29423 RepID=W0BD98_9GAMM|nr:hypothetical protein [Legionella oakridgensis]AHE66612.1 hypothetical protein Loa_01056 [Legionella oakridgensis ATCC 33761 = DSM 21215]ETO93697.1 hypothetical protein LOR_56c12680 [Legionella oakridgensis RV-2-2007]KTD37793.1 hypothetical protein Loak_1469 [Legionella oakridgensis]STY19755.1 Uncharacterised protein [Legionella longbeachae]
MNCLLKTFAAAALSLTTMAVFAVPSQLKTHNDTDFQSNAYVGPSLDIASPHPTKAHSTNSVFWGVVQVICGKRTGTCNALIKMKTDTASPVTIGQVTLNLDTGDITPKSLTANGFTITVIGPGETRITQD